VLGGGTDSGCRGGGTRWTGAELHARLLGPAEEVRQGAAGRVRGARRGGGRRWSRSRRRRGRAGRRCWRWRCRWRRRACRAGRRRSRWRGGAWSGSRGRRGCGRRRGRRRHGHEEGGGALAGPVSGEGEAEACSQGPSAARERRKRAQGEKVERERRGGEMTGAGGQPRPTRGSAGRTGRFFRMPSAELT
jgi:hypothetical protein